MSRTRESIENWPNVQRSQIFVIPWYGIVANIPTRRENGRFVGGSASSLRDDLMEKGFELVKVHPLWNYNGHSGYAIVEFKNDINGFHNAITFEKYFEARQCGKRNFIECSRDRGDMLYGWVAREDDYYSRSSVGKFLKDYGDLRSISDKVAEQQQLGLTLVSSLNDTLEAKETKLKEIKNKYWELDIAFQTIDAMIKKYNEERNKMREESIHRFELISNEHEMVKKKLNVRKELLEKQEKKLRFREDKNKSEITLLCQEKEMNRRAVLAQKMSNERMLKLAEDQDKETKQLQEEVMNLERKLDEKQALELEIEQLKGKLQVMKNMLHEDTELKKKIRQIEEELKEKEADYEYMEDMNLKLTVKERKNNDELQEARTALMKAMAPPTANAEIGVKKMGELDEKPFYAFYKRKCGGQKGWELATKMCSKWEDLLRNPSWHPFKIVEDKKGEAQELIDENDENLKKLKDEFGGKVYECVKTALLEMNKYNPSGRYPVGELWNFKEKRRATTGEGISFIFSYLRDIEEKKNKACDSTKIL